MLSKNLLLESLRTASLSTPTAENYQKKPSRIVFENMLTDHELALLKNFDAKQAYGPCADTTRLARWRRAEKCARRARRKRIGCSRRTQSA